MDQKEKGSLLLLKNFLIAGAATMSAVLFTNPLEVVKTRFQLQGELSSGAKPYRSLPQAFYLITKNEGFFAVQKGLVPSMWYQLAMNGTRVGFYEHAKQIIGSLIPDSRPSLIWFRNMCSGALTGAMGAAIGSPMFLIKTRLQAASTSSADAVGDQHQYRGTAHALRSIIQTDGFFGLWRSASASIIRVTVGSATQLSTYDHFKMYFLRHGFSEGILLAAASSFGTGICVCLTMNPFDVVSTRLYNQKSAEGKGTRYKGFLDCVMKITKTEGPLAFYKGLVPHYFRVGPHTVLTFIFLELYRTKARQFGLL